MSVVHCCTRKEICFCSFDRLNADFVVICCYFLCVELPTLVIAVIARLSAGYHFAQRANDNQNGLPEYTELGMRTNEEHI